jgi:hypothetical protein
MPLLSTLKYSTAKSSGASAGGRVILSASRSSVEEGEEVTFILNGAEPEIDVPYTITGITANDLFSGSLTGNFTVDAGGDGQLTFILSRTDGDYVDEIMTMTLDGTAVYIDVTILNTTEIVGESVYDIPGTYSWTCPDEVTSVCVVAIGGGGGSWSGAGTNSGGGGGGLAYTNNISVTPGQTYTVGVGVGGTGGQAHLYGYGTYSGQSYFISGSYRAIGGGNGMLDDNGAYTPGGNGGGYIGQGGGNGGTGGYIGASYASTGGIVQAGGGGAGGYSSNGGYGGFWNSSTGNAGGSSSGNRSGGGGGGARVNNYNSGYGGGASLYGSATTGGNAGAGGAVSSNTGGLSGWDTRYSQLSQWSLDAGNYRDSSGNLMGTSGRYSKYGGGAGGTYASGAFRQYAYRGGHGAVRIMWGTGRSFPDNAGYIAPPSGGATVTSQWTLINPNVYGTPDSDGFGVSVAMDGNYAIVGALFEDESIYNPGGGTSSGKAYIYNVTTGAVVHTLDNPNAYSTSTGDNFGNSVAISGNYAIVGAYQENDATGDSAGAAYIFDVPTGALLHTLTNPNPFTDTARTTGTSAYGDYFANSIAISGNYAIVGAYNEDDDIEPWPNGLNSGKAYIYNVTTGALLYTLANPNPYGTAQNDRFGFSVDISGNYAIVGSDREGETGETNVGKAYIFNVATGALVHTIDYPDTTEDYAVTRSDIWFGSAVGISGNYAIVGAYSKDYSAGQINSGIAFIFNVTTGALVHKLINPNPYGAYTNDNFGLSVAISGDYASVGAEREDDAGGTDSGKAYIFNVTTGALVYTLDNPNPYGTSLNDRFSGEIDMSGNYVIFGNNAEDAGGTNTGIAYIYKLTPT